MLGMGDVTSNEKSSKMAVEKQFSRTEELRLPPYNYIFRDAR